MELNKVFDGFTVDNQLVIKAQVQARRPTTLPRTLPAPDTHPGFQIFSLPQDTAPLRGAHR